jgi:hypothetical protein
MVLGASGKMGDLDDGPEQRPLLEVEIQRTILSLLNERRYKILITHGVEGEYTKHRRHEEVSRAVQSLWIDGAVHADMLWLFAYSDGNGSILPRPEKEAHMTAKLPEAIWEEKYRIMTDIYGFLPDSWEARTTPKEEAFWCFESPFDLKTWLNKKGRKS